ncbi:hypothetical protein AVEN_124438-1 [Araneus ventricosus]|uniref:Uncharacterized protein n=1 Tax=Araneus ventricosus TaxID=182803 RepID=A0A4Y2HWN9_ARAVE|nr:hypothetical protein AVEN_124438-1 [Araneus ventricosus]
MRGKVQDNPQRSAPQIAADLKADYNIEVAPQTDSDLDLEMIRVNVGTQSHVQGTTVEEFVSSGCWHYYSMKHPSHAMEKRNIARFTLSERMIFR